MESMGFSDDGGWLSSLLKAKNYDVDKAMKALKGGKKE